MNEEKELNSYQVEKMLDDHEARLRRLEESDIKQQVQLAEIQKSQSDLKLLVMESNREQSKTLNDFMKTLIDTFSGTIKNNNKTTNKIRLVDRKELWGILGAIVTFLITYLSK